MPNKHRILEERLASIPQAQYPHQSRIHRVKSFSNTVVECYTKREDELGFGITGSKVRKYRTLIPSLLNSKIKECIVIGSAYSNHVLGMSQLLIENDIKPTLFLRGDPSRLLEGNALYTSLLVPHSSIHWFSKTDWKNVHEKAEAYAQNQTHKTLILPEGGSTPEALPGALTLPLDIMKNEIEAGVSFDHIFIDSGTGLMASALLLGSAWIDIKAKIHIVLMAEDQSDFLNQLNSYHSLFCKGMKLEMPLPSHFELYTLHKSDGFGKVNKQLFRFMTDFARKEGILTDPIYSGKLFMKAKHLICSKELKGKILVIHSGGAITLAGFQDQLKKSLTLYTNNLPVPLPNAASFGQKGTGKKM